MKNCLAQGLAILLVIAFSAADSLAKSLSQKVLLAKHEPNHGEFPFPLHAPFETRRAVGLWKIEDSQVHILVMDMTDAHGTYYIAVYYTDLDVQLVAEGYGQVDNNILVGRLNQQKKRGRHFVIGFRYTDILRTSTDMVIYLRTDTLNIKGRLIKR